MAGGTIIYEGSQYRLRASSPMPIQNGKFILHTFGAETNDITIYDCATSLPRSSDFKGQGGHLVSASFSKIGDSTGSYFQGREVEAPQYVEEEDYY